MYSSYHKHDIEYHWTVEVEWETDGKKGERQLGRWRLRHGGKSKEDKPNLMEEAGEEEP